MPASHLTRRRDGTDASVRLSKTINSTTYASSFCVLAAPSFHGTVRFPSGSLPLIINEPNSFLLLSSHPKSWEYLEEGEGSGGPRVAASLLVIYCQDRKLYQFFVSGSEAIVETNVFPGPCLFEYLHAIDGMIHKTHQEMLCPES